jgi:hypothetical protein
MRAEDLRAITAIGQALWIDRSRSHRLALETITAVSMQDLTDERMLERTTAVLVGRAHRDGIGSVASQISEPFFRLSAEERVVLIALHREKWSYLRLARVLGISPERVEEISWAARLTLGFRPGMQVGIPHPAGAKAGTHCPDFNPRRPWTQRFLDEEISGRERVFLQAHLIDCTPCRESLGRARAFYYSLDTLIPTLDEDDASEKVKSFERALLKAKAIKEPYNLSFGETLIAFTSRPEIQKGILIFIGAMFAYWAYSTRSGGM